MITKILRAWFDRVGLFDLGLFLLNLSLWIKEESSDNQWFAFGTGLFAVFLLWDFRDAVDSVTKKGSDVES